MAKNLCALCDEPTTADRGLMCPRHRAEDLALRERPFTDDVDPAAREPKEPQA